MNGNVDAILNGFDRVLEDEKSLNTRSGLRFAITVLRQAFAVTAEIDEKYDNLSDRLQGIEQARDAEKKLKEQKEEDERWSRRVVFGTALAALTMLLLNGLVFLFSTIPLINKMIEAAQP